MSLLPTDRTLLPASLTQPIHIDPDGTVPCINCGRALVLDFTALNGWLHEEKSRLFCETESAADTGYLACPQPPTDV